MREDAQTLAELFGELGYPVRRGEIERRRGDAHRFYEALGYSQVAHHFFKKLPSVSPQGEELR